MLDVAKVGCLAVLIGYCIFGVAMLVRRGGESRKAGRCLSNMIQVWRGMRMHAAGHEGALPPAESWSDALLREKLIPDEHVLHCPKAAGRYGYAMNSQFGGAELERITDPTQRVLLFESTTNARNAHDRLESIPVPPRHPRGNHYIFVDGHGEWLQEVPRAEGGNEARADVTEGEKRTDG